MFTPENVILGLKLAVSLVTVLLIASLIAISMGYQKLHGKINLIFFILTLIAVVGFEAIIRWVNPQLTAEFTEEQQRALSIHLCFSVPSTILLPFMLFTGKWWGRYHRKLAFVFLLMWTGTFITGVFFLPHSFTPAQ